MSLLLKIINSVYLFGFLIFASNNTIGTLRGHFRFFGKFFYKIVTKIILTAIKKAGTEVPAK